MVVVVVDLVRFLAVLNLSVYRRSPDEPSSHSSPVQAPTLDCRHHQHPRLRTPRSTESRNRIHRRVLSTQLTDPTMSGQQQDADPSTQETQPLLAPSQPAEPPNPVELRRQQALQDFKRRLIEHREWDANLKTLRLGIRDLEKAYEKTEDDMKALQSVGQIVGEVLKQLDEEKFIVKASSGPRYVVGCRNKVNKDKLKQGARVGIVVSLDLTNDSA